MTQQEAIINLLEDGKVHSSLEMRNELFIMMPATRIFELKEDGFDIKSEPMPCKPKDPNSKKIAWYRLMPEEPKQDRLLNIRRENG